MRILAIANAHALAHVSRLLEIAKVLRTRGHEIVFAGHGKYLQAAGWDDFETHELPYISVERAIEAIRSQKLWTLYPENELETFIAAELALYKSVQPDLVLLDNRPTARTSAEIAGLKTVAVLNVHMSNYRCIPFFSYNQLTGGLPGTAIADRLENALERQVYNWLVMGGLNAIRRRKKLRPLFAYEHEEGELASLLADIPEFNPAMDLPPRMKYIGPLTWRNTLPPPACMDMLDPDRPVAYFALGSESLDELLAHLGELACQGIQIVVAAGAVNVGNIKVPEGMYLEQYINTDALLPHCDLVVCHGGNGTLYQALSYGLPSVVVATHAEQHYGGKRIKQLGLGIALTLKHLQRKGIGDLVEAVRHILATPSYRNQAQTFSQYLKNGDSAVRAADEIEKIFR